MESEAHLFSFCLLMTEFKATDFPFGKASGPSPQMLLCYILTVLIFFSTQELFRKAFVLNSQLFRGFFVIIFDLYDIVNKESGIVVCMGMCSIGNKKEYIFSIERTQSSLDSY